jgi:hypothetical protein
VVLVSIHQTLELVVAVVPADIEVHIVPKVLVEEVLLKLPGLLQLAMARLQLQLVMVVQAQQVQEMMVQ